MAIKIVLANLVAFAVAGTFNTENGKKESFDFRLTAKRMDQATLDQTQVDLFSAAKEQGNHRQITDLLCGTADDPESGLVSGWSGVRDADDAPLAYSPELLRKLINTYPGLHLAIWRAYQSECGAKEKN